MDTNSSRQLMPTLWHLLHGVPPAVGGPLLMLSVQFQGTKGAGLPSTRPTWSPGVCELEGRWCPLQAQPVSIQMSSDPG